ncbi:MAG: TonB-dependent receptor [Bacteroidota bacterium]
MRVLFTFSLLLCWVSIFGQSGSLKGQLQDEAGGAVIFANVALYSSTDSSMVKVETSNESGIFQLVDLQAGNYFLQATYVGMPDLIKSNLEVQDGQMLDLGVISFGSSAVNLEEVTVKAKRAMVEVKSDRTVFNVEGTINSVGADAVSLLRMAPGVTIDNNNNISVLGRTGVLLYVDGKRLPLTGSDLDAFLENLTAEQIDRIDIITNPSAKYEAEGNAGIIDIRLKRDKNLGANGSVNGSYRQGRYATYNGGISGNFRNKRMNVFGNAGFTDGKVYNNMFFTSTQNNIFLDETNRSINTWDSYNYRLGADFFISPAHTVGILFGGRQLDGFVRSNSNTKLAPQATPMAIDSVLQADNTSDNERGQNTFNINYRYDNQRGKTLNIDLDYGRYDNESIRYQPNLYYDATETQLLSSVIKTYDSPTDIDIYTFKVDYEQKLMGGQLGFGTKFSQVISDNTFLVYDEVNGEGIFNDSLSNQFDYDERVYAGYVSYQRPINEKLSFSAGLRAELTDATGDLKVFRESLQEEPVELNYLNFFPNVGLTWQVGPKHSINTSYGRRINRPDYNVLNPFNVQLNELSYEKGNPTLSPEIVNNFEIGYTYAYRYNFKLGYSRTLDQITRLIAPDDIDERAGFITWANLAEQTIISFNASAPVQIHPKWNAYFNFSASHLDNQADYGEGAIVDLQAFTYSIFTQHTITLPKGFTGEISGYFSGPGIWGGVFEYESNWSLNAGLQRRFLEDRLNVKISVSDIFYQTGWDGVSRFDGLVSFGSGRWDSRRFTISANYRFGNQNVKKSRKRSTGMEDEASRVSSGN